MLCHMLATGANSPMPRVKKEANSALFYRYKAAIQSSPIDSFCAQQQLMLQVPALSQRTGQAVGEPCP